MTATPPDRAVVRGDNMELVRLFNASGGEIDWTAAGMTEEEGKRLLGIDTDTDTTVINVQTPIVGAEPRTIAEAWEESTPRDILRFLGNRATSAQDALANAPTPGGLAPLIIALIVLVWAVVAVTPQGATRLQLVWYTLLDRTRLIGSRRGIPPNMGGGTPATAPPITDPSVPGSGGGGGGFGSGEQDVPIYTISEVIDFSAI